VPVCSVWVLFVKLEIWTEALAGRKIVILEETKIGDRQLVAYEPRGGEWEDKLSSAWVVGPKRTIPSRQELNRGRQVHA